MDIKGYILSAVKNFKIELSDEQLNQLESYYKLLVSWNERMNLTAITEPKDVAIKHFADSLSVLSFVDVPNGASVIDVGTGAGFPGLVLKIARPDIKLTLLDSLKKRLTFLEDVLNNLGLDAQLIHSRAEEGGQSIDLRECYDFAVSRAVAQLNVLCEYCLPYVRISGTFIAFKGGESDEEIKNASKAIQTLGGKKTDVYKFDLPENSGSRTLVIIEKVQPTPDKYPRQNGKIKAKPL